MNYKTRLLALFNNDDSMVQTFIDIFKNDIPKYSKGMQQAILHQNWKEVSIVAHSMKSLLNYMELNSFSKILLTIEQLADEEEQLDKIKNLADGLLPELELIIQQIE